MASLLDLAKNVFQQGQRVVNPIVQRLQLGASNVRGNVQAITSPQTRNDYFRGLTLPTQNIGFRASQTRAPQFLQKPIASGFRAVQRVEQNPIARVPLSFGQGLISGQNLGLGRNQIQPRTPGEQGVYAVGSVLGSLNPKGATGRVIRGVTGATNPILSRVLRPLSSVAGPVATRIGAGVANVAQGQIIDPSLGRKPGDPISIGLDFVTGVALGPRQFDVPQSATDALKKVAKMGFTDVSPRALKIHQDDLLRMEEIVDVVNAGGAKRNLGDLGVDAQRLAEHYFGKKWATVSNKKLAQLFEWAIDTNRHIPRDVKAKLPKLGIAGESQGQSVVSQLRTGGMASKVKEGEFQKVVNNLKEKNPGLGQKEAEAIAGDVIKNREFNQPQPLDPLLAEARKYRSAEEFIEPFKSQIGYTNAINTTRSISEFANKQDLSELEKLRIKKGYFGGGSEADVFRAVMGDKSRVGNTYSIKLTKGEVKNPNAKNILEDTIVVDGVEVIYKSNRGQETEFIPVSKDFVQKYKETKSQLTDIYNKATTPPQTGGGATVVPDLSKGINTTPQLKQGDIASTPREVSPSFATQPKSLLKVRQLQKVRIKTSPASQSSEDIIQQAKNEIGSIKNEPREGVRESLNKIYTQWVDRFNPITKASEQAKKTLKIQGAELRPEADPSVLVRRLTGAGGIADYRYQTELKPIIDRMDNLKIEKADMDVYLKARRDIGLAARNIKGSDARLANQRIQALEAKYGSEIKKTAQALYAYQNKGFQEMVDAGFLSKESANLIRRENPDYVPFQRVMDEMDDYLGLPTRKTMQGSQPILKIKGSEKQVYSPLESVIANTFKQRAAIEKNTVAKSIVDLQKLAPDLGYTKVSQSGTDTITIWKNGQKEYWRVGEDIAETAKGVNEESMNTLLKIFTAPARLLRQGATGRNPEFMFPNVIRDQLDAGITSKYGYIPFVDYVSGLRSMLTNDDIYKKWASSGAKIDLGEMSGRKTIAASFDQARSKKRLFSWLGGALDTMGKYSEQPTRVGLFKKAYQKTGNELLSMMESRDATVDFARMGSKMRVANSIIPFLNVSVQGFDKLIRSVKNNPGKVALYAGIYGALPAITSTLYNLTQFPEEYAEIPQYEKDSNFVFVGGRNAEGTVDYVTIPKGNVLPLIANPIENFLSYMAGTNKQSLGEFATQFLSSSLPVVGEGQSLKEVAIKTIGSNLPQLIKPVTESLINKSFYKYDPKKEQSKEIVPSYLQKKEPFEQKYEWTPVMYQKIGAALNASPLQVQNLMEGYLAGFAKIPAQTVERLYAISKGEDVDPNQKTLLRRFIKTTYPSASKEEPVKPPTTPFMQRITGKADASEETVITDDPKKLTPLTDERKKQIQYTQDRASIADSELARYYLGNELSLPESNEYEKRIKQGKILSKLDDITRSESLTDDQKTRLEALVARKAGFTPEDFSYYAVARKSNDEKTLYVLDQVNTLDDSKLLDQLRAWRKPVNGKLILSDGVIDNLVSENKITEEQGKALKKLDFDPKTGAPKIPKAKKPKKPKKITIKTPKLKKFKLKTFKPVKIKQPKRVKFKAYIPKKIKVG